MIDTILKYFRPITLYRPTKSTNSFGEPVMTYAQFATVDGMIRQLQGNEQVASGQQQSKATHRMYCRPTITITKTDRIVDGGKTYQIVAVNDVNMFGALTQIDAYEVIQ